MAYDAWHAARLDELIAPHLVEVRRRLNSIRTWEDGAGAELAAVHGYVHALFPGQRGHAEHALLVLRDEIRSVEKSIAASEDRRQLAEWARAKEKP